MAKETEPGVFFFASWRKTLKELFPDPVKRAAAYDAIIDYAITGEEPDITDPMVKVFFSMAKGHLDAKEAKRDPGAPKGNRNAAKTDPKQPGIIENNSIQLNSIKTIENNSKELNQLCPDSIYDSESDSFFDRDRDKYRDRDEYENRDGRQGQGAAASNDKESNNPAAAFEAEIQREENEQKIDRMIRTFADNGIALKPMQIEEAVAFMNCNMDVEVLELAAKKAADAGKMRWDYAKGILQSWLKKKVFTLEQARKEEIDFNAEKARRKREQAAKAAGTRPADYYDPADYAKPDPDGTAWAEMFESLHAH